MPLESARLCYGSLVSQTPPILFVTYGGNEWLTAGVVRFTRLVLWCVVCCFGLLMWYAEVGIRNSGIERAQHIHSCNVDHSVCLLFILSTLTELAIKGHWFGINAVRELTNCLRHNTALWCSPSTLSQSVWTVMWTQSARCPSWKECWISPVSFES